MALGSYVAEAAFVVSALAALFLPPLARKLDLVDRPGGRKSHDGEVPIVGGVAMLTGLLVAAAFNAHLGSHGVVILLVAALIVVVGALDDRFDLPALTRLYVHILAAIVLLFGTGFVVCDLGDLFGFGVIHLFPLCEIFSVLAVVALINGFNMLDGLDGLAGGAAFFAFLGLAILAGHLGAPTSAMIAAAMIGAIGAFLVFNLPVRLNRRWRVFMGDGGSTLLGFVFAAIALTLVQEDRADVPPVLLLWFVPIPIFELFSTTFRRALRGRSPMEADDGHFHHQLRRRGLSVSTIFIVYLCVSGLSMATGLLAHEVDLPEPMMLGGFLGFYVLWLAALGTPSRLLVTLLGLLGAASASADK